MRSNFNEKPEVEFLTKFNEIGINENLGKYLSGLVRWQLEYFENNCNFTDEEENVFRFLAKGKSRDEISIKMQISKRTVDRRVQRIRLKMLKIGNNTEGGIRK